jgi:hypothetical protein
MTETLNPRAASTPDASSIGTAALQACAAAGAAAVAEAFVLFASAGFAPGIILVVFPVFLVAFVLAAAHLLLAVPLYLLLLRTGAPVGTGTAAAAGFLIGAFSIPLLSGWSGPFPHDWWAAMLMYGLPGLAAGFAFGRH